MTYKIPSPSGASASALYIIKMLYNSTVSIVTDAIYVHF